MTRVEFFFNVDDKPAKVAELAASALKKKRRLMLFAADAAAAQRLAHYMWSYPVTAFLPHCPPDHQLAAETPIIIDWQGEHLPHDDVLVNLKAEHPPFFSRFRRLIEIVGRDEEDKAAARLRYRFYKDRGYDIKSFDVTGNAL